MNRNFVVVIVFVLFGYGIGCATPVGYTNKPLQTYDKDTEYRVDDEENGFKVTVYYARYQFMPESDVVASAGKSALLHIALEEAKTRGHEIQKINEQEIQMSMGRNGLSGITSYSGVVVVHYEGVVNGTK